MKSKGKQLLLCLLLGQFMLLPSVAFQRAEANSAQRYWEGESSTGVIIKDENCPLEVQSEKLVFNIGELPNYASGKSFSTYSANVSAEYTFYNPADYTIKATLVFPFGQFPYWYTGDDSTSLSDTEKYDITVNGESVEKTLRYTLSPSWNNFDIDKDLPLLTDGYIEDEFYSPDLPVTCYQYDVSGIDPSYDDAFASFQPSLNTEKTRVWFVESNGWRIDGDKATLNGWARNGKTFTVYVFGEPLLESPKWSLFEDGSKETVIDGRFNLKCTTDMTFERFVFEEHYAEYPENSEISEVDWYNAIVSALNGSVDKNYGMIHPYYRLKIYNFMRWYEYEIEVAPKSTLINKVTAPLYPSIDGEYSPEIFEYTYLLSPAKTWSKFGTLDIEIHTPYYLLDDTKGFTKTETGYVLSLEGLPDGELIFKLCASDTPERNNSGCFGWYFVYLLLIPISCVSGIQDAIGCSAVVSTCGVFVPLILSATILLIKKRK